MTGTLAPPPAYGSDAGSILLDAGYGSPGAGQSGFSGVGGVGALLEAARNRTLQQPRSGSFNSVSTSGSGSGRPIPSSPPNHPPRSPNSSQRHRRAGKSINLGTSVPAVPSPLRTSESGPGPSTSGSRRRALGRVAQSETTAPNYISPTDTPLIAPRIPSPDALDRLHSDEEEQGEEDSEILQSPYHSGSEEGDGTVPESPMEHNPPTPNLLDISLHSLRNSGLHNFGGRQASESGSEDGDSEDDGRFLTARRGGGSGSGSGSGESDDTIRVETGQQAGMPNDSPSPPGYAPLDPHMYASKSSSAILRLITADT